MALRIGSRVFAPGLVATIATALLMPGLIALGVWQLGRAELKRELIAAYEAGATETAVVGDQRALAAQPRYQTVRVRGHYEPARQVLLDNMPSQQGRPGYQVLTPFALAGGGHVLVNRGWVPLGATRADLPDVAVDAEPRTVVGIVDGLPRPGLRLDTPAAVEPEAWPVVLNFPTAGQLRDLYDLDLPDAQLLLDPDLEDGYERAWQARFGIGPERHVGYAVQWFALAAALFAIYIVVNLRRVPGSNERA